MCLCLGCVGAAGRVLYSMGCPGEGAWVADGSGGRARAREEPAHSMKWDGMDLEARCGAAT
jgi:hypothetical protein